MALSKFHFGVVGACLLGVTLWPLACASGPGGEPVDVASQGGAGMGTGQGGVGNFRGRMDDDGSFDDDACASTSAELESQPMDVVLVMDRSESMSGKWAETTQSLSTFFNDEASNGLSVAITFFPHLGSTDECDPTAYQVPVVELSPLPEQAATVVSVLNAVTTDGATPTHGALEGVYHYTAQVKQSQPERMLIVVLASDGDPCCETCAIEEIGPIAQLAAGALANGVPTYTVAIEGSSVANLDLIAQAGGTEHSYDITSDVALLAEALDEIRSALGCDYDLPDPGENNELDLKKVNVVFTPGGGSEETIPKEEAGATACDDQPAWYYKDDATVSLCPSTCAMVRADVNAQVDVLFGCETVVK